MRRWPVQWLRWWGTSAVCWSAAAASKGQWHQKIDPTANTVFHQKRASLPKTAQAQNEYSCDTFDKLILASIDIIHRRPKIPDFTKKAQVSWMCFLILNDLYTAHHNSLGTCICHQLKIRHLYGTFNFSTQCICMATGSLFVYGLRCFHWKACPLRRKNIFAVASIAIFHCLPSPRLIMAVMSTADRSSGIPTLTVKIIQIQTQLLVGFSGVGRLWWDKALEGQAIVCEQWLPPPPMLYLLRAFQCLWLD